MPTSTSYVEQMTDSELYNELKKYGFSPGPVVQSTRGLYIKKLISLLEPSSNSGNQKILQNDEPENPDWSDEDQAQADTSYETKHKIYSKEKYRPSLYDSIPARPGLRRPREIDDFSNKYDPKNVPYDSKATLLSHIKRESIGNVNRGDTIITQEQRRFPSDQFSNLIRRGGLQQQQYYTHQQRPAMNPRGRRVPFLPTTWKMLILVSVIVGCFIFYVLQEWRRTDPYDKVEEDARKLLSSIESES